MLNRLRQLSPRKGRVLEVKLGYNPNSSSIGADLTPILLFSSFLSVAVPSLVLFLKSRSGGKGEPLGTDSGAAPVS